ncbi:MAG: tetratricopeptide repeat protein [Bacteroidota bacterium]|nr:tetratricopeptide repeat protein [Bacteroidota bacterium]
MSEVLNILKASFINKPILVAALVIFILSGPSCSVRKNNILSREYHKTLAHYNGYFNAREKVKEGAKTLYTGQVDRYDRILSVFKYGTEDQAKAIFPEMDEAIKKVSIVIQRHSMEIDGKERNKWIEDCYLLIGKAQFYKHDTWTAIESFQYVAAQYRSEPIRYDALLWLTQCYLRLGKMPDADYLLSTMKDDQELPTELKAFYNATYADYYLLQNELPKAAEHLEKARAMSKKRMDRYRYAFILGQIYQKLDKHPEAVARYDNVIKLSPPYEMAFNARVNRARSVDVNSDDGKEIRKMLQKMLTDEKNTEYQDQIYYALAEISLKENNIPEALELLKKSAATSAGNTNQKALSYLKMAEIYFKQPEYKLAQMYYDSTAATISEDHPDYLAIINTKNNLNKLIRNLNIIYTEDSLQALAAKSPAEREAIINQLIEEEKAEKARLLREKKEREAAEKEAQEQNESSPFFNAQNTQQPQTNQSGTGWYFSNQSAVSFGFNEFVRMWGNRKLEDNWRRSTRTSFAEAQNLEETTEELDSTEILDDAARDSILALDNSKRKTAYLSAIPSTPEQKAKSDEKIVEAYYNVGLIYKEQLKDNKESNKNFETLLQRYPENDYKLPTIYNLYRVNLALGDEEKANYYKNIILTEYAETEYAKIILNPDYFKDQQRKVAIQKVFYENTYRAYLNKQYDDVIERKTMADSLFPASDLAPKFEFLRAMAIGKSRSLPEFETALKGVIAHHPEDTVSVRAKEILGMIDPSMYNRVDSIEKPSGTPAQVVEAPKPVTPWTFSPDTMQYVVFIYVNNVISTNDFKIAVSNYNNKFYSIKKLQISSSFVGEENQMMMIRQFNNKQDGVTYLNGLTSDPEAFVDIDISNARYFTITPDNLLLLMQTKDIDGYDAFYEEKYLN